MTAADDAGARYRDSDSGAFDSRTGLAAASHGTRDLGGQNPPQTRRLTIRFQPAEGWNPPGPWRREILVDLRERRLLA